jgi:N,N'-diacetyllegionaminate synthase
MIFKIGDVTFGKDKTVIIAEAGVNHLGRMDYAEELIKTAARAGADVVKFQTYKADSLSTKNAPRFWSWEGEEKTDGSQHDSYSKLDSFEREQYLELIDICKKYNVTFMSTPFDKDSVDMLVDIGMQGFKIASCDLTNLPFLSYIAKKKLPMLISTGAANIEEIKKAVKTIEDEGNKQICIMHCTLCYPTEIDDSNLSALLDIEEHFPGYMLGLSDHTLGTLIPAASVLYNSQVIEKHYTFDKTLPDSADHWLSLNEKELAEMVAQVRELERAKGGGKKITLECETPAHKFARRSVVTNARIIAGATIKSSDVTCKRPGTGMPPVYLDRVIGSVALHDIEADSIVVEEDIEWKI